MATTRRGSGYTVPRRLPLGSLDRIAADMEVLSKVEGRFAGTEGERAMLHAVRQRLPDGTVGRIEGFVAHTEPAFVQGMHTFALVLGGLLGLWVPWAGAFVCGVVTVSLLSEGAGQPSLFRWFLPRSPSYNCVVRPGASGASPGSRPVRPLGTVIVATPLDAPRWRPLDVEWVRGRRPMRVAFAAALVVTAMLVLRTLAEPWGPRTHEIYLAALAVLAGAAALGALAHRRGGRGRDDASGPATVLELMRRLGDRPAPGVDVWYAFTGCGRAWQGGMESFLALHERSLTDPVLVVAVDAPGRQPLRAAVSEGPLFPQYHRPTGPALIERLRWAGVILPAIDHAGATDARAAALRGYRALALVGGEGSASPEAAVRAVDVLETVVRWFGDDLARVADNRPALADLARATTEPPVGDGVPEPVSAEGA